MPVCFRPEIIVQRYNELLAEMHMGEAMLEYPNHAIGLGRHFIEASEREEVSAHYLVFGSKVSLSLCCFRQLIEDVQGLSGGKAALGSVAAYCVKHARVGVMVVKASSRDLRTDEVLNGKGVGHGDYK